MAVVGNQRGLIIPLYGNHTGPITLHLPDGSQREASMADAMELMDLEDALPSARARLPDWLCSAAHRGDCPRVREWLAAGGDVNATDVHMNGTMLMAASACRHVELVNLLLAHGARVDAIDRWGCTALSSACCSLEHQPTRKQLAGDAVSISPREMVVQLLLTAGAEPDHQDSLGLSALMVACVSGEADCIKILMRSRASAELREANGHTANSLAQMYGQHLALRLLQDSVNPAASPTGRAAKLRVGSSAKASPTCSKQEKDAGVARPWPTSPASPTAEPVAKRARPTAPKPSAVAPMPRELGGPRHPKEEAWTVHDGKFFANHVISGQPRAPNERKLSAEAVDDAAPAQPAGGAAPAQAGTSSSAGRLPAAPPRDSLAARFVRSLRQAMPALPGNWRRGSKYSSAVAVADAPPTQQVEASWPGFVGQARKEG